MDDEGIVIVGGGLAASRVVRGYRAAGGSAPLTIVSDDDVPPYSRPPLSKGYLRGETAEEDVYAAPASFYDEHGADLRLETSAVGVDTDGKSVELDDGSRLSYASLVLASGSKPRKLGVPGEDLDGVHTYRTLADARSVKEAAASASSAVVVGSGFIGMETTASLRRLGLAVTQVDLGTRLYAAFQAPALSDSLERLYRERGVKLALGDRIAEFRGVDGRLAGARTVSGLDIDAQVAIVGVGVSPSTGYLSGSGVELDDVGAVVVDERFRTSVDDVYAIGDVARFHDPVFGHARLIQHWTNADHQGDRLGRLLAGEDAPYDLVAYFFTEVFGTRMGLLGDLDGGHDELVLRGSLEEGALLGFYLRANRLVAALLSGQDDETRATINELLRRQPEVTDRQALADPAADPARAFA
jgi:NADPH-dependent 2,4-dienoyl-CoA reductase/sulfur reductase-like enzyme